MVSIIKDDGKSFTELVNGQWVEPTSPVSLDDFLKVKLLLIFSNNTYHH